MTISRFEMIASRVFRILHARNLLYRPDESIFSDPDSMRLFENHKGANWNNLFTHLYEIESRNK